MTQKQLFYGKIIYFRWFCILYHPISDPIDKVMFSDRLAAKMNPFWVHHSTLQAQKMTKYRNKNWYFLEKSSMTVAFALHCISYWALTASESSVNDFRKEWTTFERKWTYDAPYNWQKQPKNSCFMQNCSMAVKIVQHSVSNWDLNVKLNEVILYM